MRYLRLLPVLILMLPVLLSCNKELNVNAGWKDVTVVYGLLDASQDTNYIKITKAFLGDGDALMFASIADSSNYPDILKVMLEEYNGTTLVDSVECDTAVINGKQPGDFYYPDQLLYRIIRHLNENHDYKIVIRNKQTGKTVTSQSVIVHDFEILLPNGTVSYIPGQTFEVKWRSPKNGNGKRYQLVIRFYYTETLKSDLTSKMLSTDWVLFKDVDQSDLAVSQLFDRYFPADPFFTVVAANIPVNSLVTRKAHHCDYIFTVAAPDLCAYVDINKPSLSLIQEKPQYSNIDNGIGLFSSRYTKVVDSLFISTQTKKALTENELTKNLGFQYP